MWTAKSRDPELTRELRTGEVCYSLKLVFKPPMTVIGRTKAVTQHFLEKSFKKIYMKKKKKSDKPEKKFGCFLMSVASWCSTCFFVSCVVVFVQAILSSCPYTWHINIVILSLNISSVYIRSHCYNWYLCMSITFLLNVKKAANLIVCFFYNG